MGFCENCRTDTLHHVHIHYNFDDDDPTLGVRSEYWECTVCDERKDELAPCKQQAQEQR